MKRFFNLLFPLFTRSLHSVDVFGKYTLVDSHTSCYFRNIQLRKSAEDSCYFIIIICFFRIIEIADVNIFVYFFPTDCVTKTADLER